jgi:hypothetical protein
MIMIILMMFHDAYIWLYNFDGYDYTIILMVVNDSCVIITSII